MTSECCTVVLGLCLFGCLDVSEERAERDLLVGHAEVEGSRVIVNDGLAAVRRFDPGFLSLWANAPEIVATLDVSATAPRDWSVELRNAMPDAELRALAANGEALPLLSNESSFGTERRVGLSLEPGTQVRFEWSSPAAKEPGAFEFIEFGDVQSAIGRVGDVFTAMNAESEARFVVMAGDLTETGSEAQLARFQNEQRALRIPIFATLGNHELGAADPPFHDYFGRGSQSFVFRGVRFTLLDSASATLDPMVYGWLDGWLAKGRGATHLVFMHVPPVDPFGIRNGAFSSRAEANKLLYRLARGGVSGTFYGHIHSYYAFENAGIPAFISGGGGAIPERFDGIGRHFLVVRSAADGSTTTRIVRVD
jgi:predicted phosphodiesterase